MTTTSQAAAQPTRVLDPESRTILEVARAYPPRVTLDGRPDGRTETTIHQLTGLGPIRFAQQLNAVIDDPRALAYDPTLVARLRRIRATRRTARRGAQAER